MYGRQLKKGNTRSPHVLHLLLRQEAVIIILCARELQPEHMRKWTNHASMTSQGESDTVSAIALPPQTLRVCSCVP